MRRFEDLICDDDSRVAGVNITYHSQRDAAETSSFQSSSHSYTFPTAPLQYRISVARSSAIAEGPRDALGQLKSVAAVHWGPGGPGDVHPTEILPPAATYVTYVYVKIWKHISDSYWSTATAST